MSDQLLDLLDSVRAELDREAALVLPASSPSRIRRESTIRRRRRALVAAIVTLVVMVVAAAVVTTRGIPRAWSPPWAATPSTTATGQAERSSVSATPSVTSTPSRQASTSGSVVVFPNRLEFRTAAQIDAQTWMPSGAKALLAAELTQDKTKYPQCDNVIYVYGYREFDLISGYQASCDGGLVLWAPVDGTWKVIVATQSVPLCSDIRASGLTTTIPKELWSGQCMEGGAAVPYTPQARVRPVVVAGDAMTVLGIGELTIGLSRSTLVSRGVMAQVGGCDVTNPAPTLTSEGVSISSVSDSVDFIVVHSPQHGTQSGVKVGMTMGQVKQIYAGKVSATTVTLQIADPQGSARQAYVLTSGNTLVFMSDSRGSVAASDVVTSITLLRGSSLSIPVEIC